MNHKLSAIATEMRGYLEQLYGDRLFKIILFGSQARGDARPDSDIDVSIVLKEPVDFVAEIEKTSYVVSKLCLKHDVLVSCVFIGKKKFLYGNGAFFRNLRREGIDLR